VSLSRNGRCRSARVLAVGHLARGGAVVVDVVIVEVAGEFGGVFVFKTPFETAPGRVAQLLATLLGSVQILRKTIEVDFAGGFEGNFLFVLVELF
jgi:hypothetical protein